MAKKLLDTIKFLLRLISCVSICLLVVIVFLVIVSTIAYKQMLTSWSMQTPALRLPQGINYLAILLGCVLMIVFYVVWAILHLMKLMGRDTSKEEEGLNR